MTTTFCLAAVSQRLARPANTLSLAAIATLAINPVYLFDVGCQLSFLAIGALLWLVAPACALVWNLGETARQRLFGPRSPLDQLERIFEPWWRSSLRRLSVGLVDGIVASLVVWLAALPLVACRFHLVSPIGVILNIPLIPITSAALLLGGLSLVLSACWPPLGLPLAWLAGWLLQWTKTIVLWGVAQPWGHQFVVGPRWEWVLLFYVLLSIAMLGGVLPASLPDPAFRGVRGHRVAWWLVGIWFIPGWLVAENAAHASTLDVEVLAVGHGLAVIIQTPDGHTHLYDCGRLGDPSVGRRIVAPALWARGSGRIDTVFLSHADQDHYDGLPDLLVRFPIGQVRFPPDFGGADNPLAIQLIDQLKARGVAIRLITAPETWEEAGVVFTVLHPVAGWHPEASDNARSLVLDLGFQGRHLLLTGDLELQGLDAIVERAPPDPVPEVFLSPHHGGRSANPGWLYTWAEPRVVAVSQRPLTTGAGDALAAIEERGIPVLRTWKEGAIRFQWTDGGIVARSFVAKPETALKASEGEGPHSAPGRCSTRVNRPLKSMGSCPGRLCWVCAWGSRLRGSGDRRVCRLGPGRAAAVDRFGRVCHGEPSLAAR